MLPQSPTAIQQKSADYAWHPTLFLSGPASSGKTSAALMRLQNILNSSTNAPVLVLVPQRSLAVPYHNNLQAMKIAEGDRVSIQTMSSMVRRMINLFWPVIASYQIFKQKN